MNEKIKALIGKIDETLAVRKLNDYQVAVLKSLKEVLEATPADVKAL